MDYDTFKLFVAFEKTLKAVETTVNKIWTAVQLLQTEELTTMATAQEILASSQVLVAKVTEVEGAEDSTITLLSAIHAMLLDVMNQLAQAGTDAAALDTVKSTLDGVVTMLDTQKIKLGDAVAANPLPE